MDRTKYVLIDDEYPDDYLENETLEDYFIALEYERDPNRTYYGKPADAADRMLSETYTGPDINVGDIVMTDSEAEIYSLDHDVAFDTPHRVLVVSAINENDPRQYKGFLFSSAIGKANINAERFPANLYIDDYGSIIEAGPAPNKEAVVKVDDLYVFSDYDLSGRGGVYKGHVKQEFLDMILEARSIYKEGGDTSNITWQNGHEEIVEPEPAEEEPDEDEPIEAPEGEPTEESSEGEDK